MIAIIALASFCYQYIKKKDAVQQKVGKRRRGAVNGSRLEVKSTVLG